MRPVRNAWPGTALGSNLKFCAQILREMLEQRAFESFRVSTMDAKSRLAELSLVARDVEEERIPPVTMVPCIQEIDFYFRTDPIIRKRHRDLARLFEIHTKKTPSKQEVSRFRRLLVKGSRDLDEAYRAELDTAILTELNGAADHDALKGLLNSYMSVLINVGYDRQYLRSELVERFFKSDIKKLRQKTLNAFLKKFDGKSRTYSITVQISRQAGDYLKTLSIPSVKVYDYAELSIGAKSAFPASGAGTSSYVCMDDDAHDKYFALKDMLIALRTLEAMATLSGRSLDFRIPETGYVRQNRKQNGDRVKLTPLVLSRYTSTVTPGIASEVGSYTKTILRDFETESIERVFSSINMAALSTTSQRPENGLIALWSAIEVLLSDPPAGSPRIVYYVDSLAPCVCTTYFRRYTAAIFAALEKHEKTRLSTALSDPSLDASLPRQSRFVQMIFDPSAVAVKNGFIASLASNPLAQFRLNKLSTNFSTRGAFADSLQSHENRVRWQVFRIYRTRNNIIHGGRLPTFLSPLVMNVSEYFTSAAEAIVLKASKGRRSSSIDQTVSEVGFDYEMMKVRLCEGNPVQPLSLKEIRKLYAAR